MFRILGSLASLGCLWAQPAFEVASIKPSPPATRFFSMNSLPGARLSTTGATLGNLLEAAYHLESFQITGGPTWLNSARYDISATAYGDAVTADQKRQMIQSLLADRFRVVVHRETKQLPLYETHSYKEWIKA